MYILFNSYIDLISIFFFLEISKINSGENWKDRDQDTFTRTLKIEGIYKAFYNELPWKFKILNLRWIKCTQKYCWKED